MSATAFLKSLPRGKQPTAAEIDAAMAGNICRCGTYARIRAAVADAAAQPRLKEAVMLHNIDPARPAARAAAPDGAAATQRPPRCRAAASSSSPARAGWRSAPSRISPWARQPAPPPSALKPTQQPAGLRADRPQRRGHGHDQPAGVRPGRAHRPADDPGRGARCRLEPGAQPARHQRHRLCRPAVRHPPHRRLPYDQEQLHAVPRTRRARPGHAAGCGRSALEGRRRQLAHAGRHGARPRRPQGWAMASWPRPPWRCPCPRRSR